MLFTPHVNNVDSAEVLSPRDKPSLNPRARVQSLPLTFMVAFIDCVETCGKLERLQFHITSASFCGIRSWRRPSNSNPQTKTNNTCIWNGASHGYKHVRKVFRRCCFQVKYPQHKVNRLDGSCSSSVQEGKEFQWEKNQRIRLSIHAHTASRWQVRCCIISLWHLKKYLEQMRICVYVVCTHHFHATYCTCGGWMCVVHIHRYHGSYDTSWYISINKHSVSLHPLRPRPMLRALSQATLCLEDVVECLSTCVLCLRISNHLQLNNPSA